MLTLKPLIADITALQVDVIVNAANESLLGGGGVDGAIHRAAGPGLLQECRGLGGCPTGWAVMTYAYNLPSKCVVHTVGPIYQDGNQGEAELLDSCYMKSLMLANGSAAASIAFPCISTGAFRYPPQEAAEIAVQACVEMFESCGGEMNLREILFCCFGDADLAIYRDLLGAGGTVLRYENDAVVREKLDG